MAEIDKMVKKLDRVAKKLVDKIATKYIRVAICDDKPVLVFEPVPRYIPSYAMSMIANALSDEGLVPLFREKDDALLAVYVKPAQINACRKVKEEVSNLPEQLLKLESDIDCIRLLMEDLKERSNIPKVLILTKEGCPYCAELERELWGEHLGVKGEGLVLLASALEKIIEVDVDKCTSYPKIFNASGYPTIVVIYKGKVVDKREGWNARVKEWLKEWLFKIAMEAEKYATIRQT